MAAVDLPAPTKLAKSAVNYGRLAVWAPNPVTQISVNLVIVVVLILSSAVGFVVGIPIALLALMLAGVGVVRLIVRAVM